MTLKSRSALIDQANLNLPDNETQEISPADVRNMFKDGFDSFISKNGDSGILAIIQYANTFSITDGKQLVYADWVNAQILSIGSGDFLKLDGTNSPSANIDFGGNSITNIDELRNAAGESVFSITLKRFYDSVGNIFFDADLFLFYGQGNTISWDTFNRELPSADGSLSIKYSYNDRVQLYKDIFFNSNSIGIILTDRSTATRYRLYIDSGSLAFEIV